MTSLSGLAVAVVVLVAWASLGNTLLGARSPPPPPRHQFAGTRPSPGGEALADSSQSDYRRLYHDLLAKGAPPLQGSAAATPAATEAGGGGVATAGGSSSGSNDVSQLQAALAAERQRSQQLVQALYAAEQAATKADEAAAAARASSSESSRLAPWSEPWSWFGGDESGPQDDNVEAEKESSETSETSGSLWSTWFGSGDDEEEEGSAEHRGGEGAEKDGEDESGGWSWLNQVKDGLAAVSPFPAGSLISKTFEPSTTLRQEVPPDASPPSLQNSTTTTAVAPEDATPNPQQMPSIPVVGEPVASAQEVAPDELPAQSRAASPQALETTAPKRDGVAARPVAEPVADSVIADPAAQAAKVATQALAKVALNNDEAKKAAAKIFRKSFEESPALPATTTAAVVAAPESKATATTSASAVTGATAVATEGSPPNPVVVRGASSASWPDLSSKGHVTQETLDSLTHGVVGMPQEQPCASLGACQAMLGQPPVLSSPPGGRKWRITLMPKTENVGVRALLDLFFLF